jgi:small subunit ribosomal protein S5
LERRGLGPRGLAGEVEEDAGGGVRAVVEAAGIKDILTKSQGSANVLNVAMATLLGLKQLKRPEEMAAVRGVDVEQVLPFWMRGKG